jgi:hypothetical protein
MLSVTAMNFASPRVSASARALSKPLAADSIHSRTFFCSVAFGINPACGCRAEAEAGPPRFEVQGPPRGRRPGRSLDLFRAGKTGHIDRGGAGVRALIVGAVLLSKEPLRE